MCTLSWLCRQVTISFHRLLRIQPKQHSKRLEICNSIMAVSPSHIEGSLNFFPLFINKLFFLYYKKVSNFYLLLIIFSLLLKNQMFYGIEISSCIENIKIHLIHGEPWLAVFDPDKFLQAMVLFKDINHKFSLIFFFFFFMDSPNDTK